MPAFRDARSESGAPYCTMGSSSNRVEARGFDERGSTTHRREHVSLVHCTHAERGSQEKSVETENNGGEGALYIVAFVTGLCSRQYH